MALTLPNTTEVQIARLAKALYDAAPGNTYMSAFAQNVKDGGTAGMTNFANWLAGTVSNDPAVLAATVVSNLHLSAANQAGATNYLNAQFAANSGNYGKVILDAMNTLSGMTGDANYGADATYFNNSVATSYQYSMNAANGTTSLNVLQGADEPTFMSNDFVLTTGKDMISGSAANDTFVADIIDNQNTFQSGDRLDGGAGTDSLNIEVGLSQAFAINAKTNAIENVFVQAQSTQVDGEHLAIDFSNYNLTANIDNDISSHGIDKNVQIDAQDMAGVRQLWSENSRSNLTIEDVRENSHLTTIGMRSTDAGDVNYEVYFDNQHVTANDGTNSGSEVYLDILDQLTGHAPLQQHAYTSFSFWYGGSEYTITGLQAANTYEELRTLVADQINALHLTSLSVTRIENGFHDPNGKYGDRIVISSAGGGDVTKGVFDTGSPKVANEIDDTYFKLDDQDGNFFPALTSAEVILDNVGRGCESGDLVIGTIGGQCPGIEQFNVQVDRSSWLNEIRSTNNWLEVVNVENIRENNTAVDTHGTTETADDTPIYGNLRIDEMHDVRVFDASPMLGNVRLTASLSDEITDKYLHITDTATDPAADNSDSSTAGTLEDGANLSYRDVVDTEFSYDFGAGNDRLTLTIDEDNYEVDGTATREDFVLAVTGGAGDDNLTLSIVNYGDNLASDAHGHAHWYNNQALNANLSIYGDEGNDTITKPGAGNVIMNGGANNDTIYADNTGEKAVWVLNTTDQLSAGDHDRDIDNLKSDTNDSYEMYHTTLRLTYSGPTNDLTADSFNNGYESRYVTGTVGHAADYTINVTVPSLGYLTSDLQINQAIKQAINNDAVLSKLLSAHDGPANTLVIESLIDGEVAADSIQIEFATTTASSLSTSEISDMRTAYGMANNATASELVAHMQTQINNLVGTNDYTLALANDGSSDLSGDHSHYTSDNHITGGTGDDVLVLGTGHRSNDTIVYSGYDVTTNGLNDHDTVVNFDSVWYDAGYSYTDYDVANNEVITVTFAPSDGSPAAQTITFDGVTVNLSEPLVQGVIPAIDIAYQFANQFVGAANWHVASFVEGSNQVVLENNAAGNVVTNVTATDFTGTYFGAANGNGAVTVATLEEGVTGFVAGVQTTFDVQFDVANTAANAAGSFTFDGVTISYLQGDGAITLADRLGDATFSHWDAVNAGNGLVHFTANARGVLASGTTADFDVDGATAGIVGSVTETATGVDDTGSYTDVFTVAGPSDGHDMIDFSSYDVYAVVVDGVTIATDATTTSNQYITMTESTTNDGVYTVVVMDDNGTLADTQVGVVGVIDFGDTQTFHDVNFVI
ncbi:MAG: hypothetical protein HGA96_08115 [Desulfobulbaceae bacterium]|nr:hypothetical protein [Desulfobulbaceae bacterium]